MSIQKYRKYLKAHSLYCRNEANFVTKRKKFHNPPDRIAHRSRDSIYPIFMVITYYTLSHMYTLADSGFFKDN